MHHVLNLNHADTAPLDTCALFHYFMLLTPFVVIGLWLAVNIVKSRTGRALSAVNDSETSAECLGVDTFALRLRVFVLSAGYAGLAGVF